MSEKQRSLCRDVHRTHDSVRCGLCWISTNCRLWNFLKSTGFLKKLEILITSELTKQFLSNFVGTLLGDQGFRFFLVSRLIWMVGRRKLRFVNFGLRIILTFLKIRNGDPANTSQNWHVGSAKFAVRRAKIEPLGDSKHAKLKIYIWSPSHFEIIHVCWNRQKVYEIIFWNQDSKICSVCEIEM